jgi:hypothetical protein
LRLLYLFVIRVTLSLQLLQRALATYNPSLLCIAYRFLLGAGKPCDYLVSLHGVAFAHFQIHNSARDL